MVFAAQRSNFCTVRGTYVIHYNHNGSQGASFDINDHNVVPSTIMVSNCQIPYNLLNSVIELSYRNGEYQCNVGKAGDHLMSGIQLWIHSFKLNPFK